MNEEPHTIAIVEDDPGLREHLSEMITASPRWRLTAALASAEEAMREIPGAPPQVVLMDIQLPGMSGIGCVEKLTAGCPGLQVMMVTVYDNNDRIFDALAAGASGYLLKRDVPAKLMESLDDLLAGGSPMSSAIARKVVQRFQRESPAPDETDTLTPREKEILDQLATGSLYKEIAWDLGIGVETVRTHLRSVYSKLHVRTRTEAVVKYLRRR